jgi:hypothetical protein
MDDLWEWVVTLMKTEIEEAIPQQFEFDFNLSTYYESDGICYVENENGDQ